MSSRSFQIFKAVFLWAEHFTGEVLWSAEPGHKRVSHVRCRWTELACIAKAPGVSGCKVINAASILLTNTDLRFCPHTHQCIVKCHSLIGHVRTTWPFWNLQSDNTSTSWSLHKALKLRVPLRRRLRHARSAHFWTPNCPVLCRWPAPSAGFLDTQQGFQAPGGLFFHTLLHWYHKLIFLNGHIGSWVLSWVRPCFSSTAREEIQPDAH